MVRSLICAITLIFSVSSAHANATHLNPAQPAKSNSMATFAATTIPIGYYKYCERYAERCARPSNGSMIDLSPEAWLDITGINAAVNAEIEPKTDQEIFGVEEYWEYPTVIGDCEDYVLAKRKQLNEIGYPLGALLITVGRDTAGGGHAVLTVVTNSGDFVLDNVEKDVLLWRDTELYFLKRQSQENPNVWVSLKADS